jgi:hypothetical protein
MCAGMMLAAVACAPTRRGPGDDGTGGDASNASGSNGSDSNCGMGAEFVYTIDEFTNQLSRFDPHTKTFTDLGALSCNQGAATPFSMGVDRNTIAWVLYDSGTLYHVDINHGLACTPTTWTGSMGLHVFGMGFSTDVAGGTTDSLFVGGGASQMASSYSLAKVNTSAMTAQVVGTEPDLPEMTGNSNAELWGFIPSASDARVVQFDKANGDIIKAFDVPSLAGTSNGYAFAHWGGDYWVFLSTQSMTTVYQIDHTSGAITSTTLAPGRTVVGAGVSTCAPVVLQ